MDKQNPISFLENIFLEEASNEAIIWNDQIFTYRWLYDRVQFFKGLLVEKNIDKSAVVVLKGDFTPESIALMLAFTIFFYIMDIEVTREKWSMIDLNRSSK